MTIHAVTDSRWQEAQRAERSYWYPSEPRAHAERRAEVMARARWIAELLEITPVAVMGKSVLDIGGGPQPIVAWRELPLARRIVVDTSRSRLSSTAVP
jgi:hypothetical protein